MRLSLCTWQDVDRYLARSQLVLMPIGSTEQHGPNGILGTDHLCAEAIAVRVGEREDVAVAPAIPIGMALHHMAFPGSMSLQPQTLLAVIRDCVGSLYQHGFRRFVFVNGHGGNTATGRVAFSALGEELRGLTLRWVNWWEPAPVRELCRELFGDREGQHATPSEVSVTMALHPDAVRAVDGPLDIESCKPRGIPGSVEFRQLYPDGRMGSDPSLATREHGERLLAVAVDCVAAVVREIAGA